MREARTMGYIPLPVVPAGAEFLVRGASVPGVVSKAARLVSVVRLGREAPGEEKPGDRVVLVARRQVAVKLF